MVVIRTPVFQINGITYQFGPSIEFDTLQRAAAIGTFNYLADYRVSMKTFAGATY